MNNENEIKGILFDLGNVIIPFDNQIAARKFAQYADKKTSEIYDIIFDSPVVNEFSNGKIVPREFFKKVKEIFGLDKEINYEKFKSIWNSIFLDENKKVCDLIKKLINEKEYKIVLISNINQIHFEHIEENYDIVNEIEDKVLSYKVGASKPDSKMYNEAFKKAMVKPKNAVYVDDRLDLIKAGENLGLHCIHYKGYDGLIKDLRKFKIKYF